SYNIATTACCCHIAIIWMNICFHVFIASMSCIPPPNHHTVRHHMSLFNRKGILPETTVHSRF
ncbi:MAG: hypothetical protein QNL64_04880, partial [Porticoccus sp.]